MAGGRREEPEIGVIAAGLLPLATVNVPPPPPHYLARTRLFRLLDDRRPVTVLVAAGGFGKTTLVSGWAAQAAGRERVAWLALDAVEGDPHLLLAQWIAAIRRIEPQACRVAGAMLGEARGTGPRAVLNALLNALGDETRGAPPWTFVLDDYPAGEDQIDALVAHAGDHLPAGARLILLSRGEPALPLARWRAAGRLAEIGMADLRFTRDEAEAFLTGAMRLDLRPEGFALIERRVEGWAAGLQLAALWLRGRDGDAPLDPAAFDGGHRFIAEYLATEILAKEDEATRTFLRATAIVDRFTAPLCDALLQRSGSAETIDRLRRRGLFLLALDERNEWLRYHPLFRDFLRRGTGAAGTGATGLHRRASAWFEAAGLPAQAIRHALASGDATRAAALVAGAADAELSRGEFHRLLRWLEALPEAELRADAELSGYKAWLLYMRGRIVEAERCSDIVAGDLSAGGPDRRSGPLLAFRAFLAINRNRLAEAEREARAALAALDGTASFFGALAMLLLGSAQRISGDRPAAMTSLRSAIRLAEAQGNLPARLEAASDLVPLLHDTGRLRDALSLCEETIAGIGEDPRGISAAGLLHIRFGQMLYEQDALERAETEIVRGLDLCGGLGNLNYLYLGKRHRARAAFAAGERDRAHGLLAEAARIADRAEHARQRRLILALEAEFLLREGDILAAATLIGTGTELTESATEYEQTLHVRLLLAQDRPRMAESLLCRMEAGARREGRLTRLFTVLALQALAAEGRGQPQAANRLAGAAVALAGPAGYLRTLLDLGPGFAAILRRLTPAVPHAARYLGPRAEPVAEQSSGEPATTDVGTEPLTARETGILRLLARGMSNRDIAERLGISVGTAKWHIHHIYQKLGAPSRTAAVYRAREMCLITD